MKALRFGHLSDTHLIGAAGQPQGVTAKLLEAGGDPLASLNIALDELAVDRPDFLIFTGDMCHEGTENDYADLRELLDKKLPRVPVLAALGNHDVRDAFRKGFLGDNYGGAHPYLDTLNIGDIRVISIDTAWEKKLSGSVGDDQLDWLEQRLKEPVKGGNILIFHHPVCPSLAHAGMELSPRLERILRGGSIIAMFNGHVHRACFSSVAGVPHFTGQSLGFSIGVLGKTCSYTTGGGYSMCSIDEEGQFFVENRATSSKGVLFHQKEL